MHSSAIFLIEFGAIILALGLLGRLAGRLQFSPIPLYLLAGLAFGEGGILPLGTSEEFVAIGAEIGVILLLLMLGLEYTASDLVSNLKTQYPAGLVDAALNALPGAAMAVLLGWGPVAAVVLAGVTWISSSGVIAKVLGDLGRLGNRETPVILSILVLEDLSMAVYLPILTALLAGAGLAAGSITLAIALGVAGLVLLTAVRYGRHISRFVSSNDPEKLLLVVLGLTLLVAGLAQQLQVSAAVGAFLVGIALSGEVAEGAHNLLAPLRDLFAAVFFVFFGLHTDPASIPPVLLPALLLAVVTALTKIATGYWAAKRSGISAKGRWRAGGALVARGEFSIVIAGLAVTAGIEPGLGPLATAYVLILVVLGPLTARYTEPAAAWIARRRSPPEPRPAAMPSGGGFKVALFTQPAGEFAASADGTQPLLYGLPDDGSSNQQEFIPAAQHSLRLENESRALAGDEGDHGRREQTEFEDTHAMQARAGRNGDSQQGGAQDVHERTFDLALPQGPGPRQAEPASRCRPGEALDEDEDSYQDERDVQVPGLADADEGERGEHDGHGAPRPRPGDERLFPSGNAEDSQVSGDGHRPAPEQEREADSQGEQDGRRQVAGFDEQADLGEPSDVLGKGTDGGPVRQVRITQDQAGDDAAGTHGPSHGLGDDPGPDGGQRVQTDVPQCGHPEPSIDQTQQPAGDELVDDVGGQALESGQAGGRSGQGQDQGDRGGVIEP